MKVGTKVGTNSAEVGLNEATLVLKGFAEAALAGLLLALDCVDEPTLLLFDFYVAQGFATNGWAYLALNCIDGIPPCELGAKDGLGVNTGQLCIVFKRSYKCVFLFFIYYYIDFDFKPPYMYNCSVQSEKSAQINRSELNENLLRQRFSPKSARFRQN